MKIFSGVWSRWRVQGVVLGGVVTPTVSGCDKTTFTTKEAKLTKVIQTKPLCPLRPMWFKERQHSLTHLTLRSLLGLLALVGGADVSAAPISPEEMVQRIVAENPTLIAARSARDEAEARLRGAGRWSNPDLELATKTDRWQSDDGAYTHSVGLVQRFPVTGRFGLEKKIAQLELQQIQADLQDQTRLLVGTARGALLTAQLLEEQLQTDAALQKRVQTLVAVTDARVAQAELSPAEAMLERLELKKIEVHTANLRRMRERTLATVQGLLGVGASEVEIRGRVDVPQPGRPLPPLSLQLLEDRPDLRKAQLVVEKAAVALEHARAARFDDWSVGVHFERERSAGDGAGSADDSLSANVVIPFPVWDRGEAKVAEFGAAKARAEAEMHALRTEIQRSYIQTYWEALELGQTIVAFERDTQKVAEENGAVLERGYRDGLVSITTVLQGLQQLLELQDAYAALKSEYFEKVVALETAAGRHPLVWRNE